MLKKSAVLIIVIILSIYTAYADVSISENGLVTLSGTTDMPEATAISILIEVPLKNVDSAKPDSEASADTMLKNIAAAIEIGRAHV